jgi:hypothetical protein
MLPEALIFSACSMRVAPKKEEEPFSISIWSGHVVHALEKILIPAFDMPS